MTTRISALAETFRSYGAEMTEVFGMETPGSFPTDPNDEHDAIREAVGLWDSSVVNKLRIRGKDALRILNSVTASNIHKVAVGKAGMFVILSESGLMDDDGLLFRYGENDYLVSVGGGNGEEKLKNAATGKNATVEYDADTHIVAVQGPKAVSLIDAHADDDIASLPFYNFIETQLFGRDVRVSRTGFSGERGYEILVGADSVVPVYTQLVEHGTPMGLVQCTFESINKARLEAGLPICGMDIFPHNSPWEVGYGWAISREKEAFLGKDKLFELKGNETVKLCGVVVDHDQAVEWEAPISVGGSDAGKITSSCYSRRMGKSIALAQLVTNATEVGTRIEITSGQTNYRGEVVSMPLYDPEKKLLRAK